MKAMERDVRLIEDVIPIEAISREASSEKVGGRIGHPSTLHLWWARRPLAAARAAIYAALVPAEGRRRSPEEESSFFEALCSWGGPQAAIDDAREEVLAANGGDPPKVLDLFAGGGAIPLEALRLGCEATAIELNPVAHIIERCMLEYPQRFPELADDVRRWGKLWVDRAWEQLKDLYPPVDAGSGQQELSGDEGAGGRRPIAYLWTRTVPCPNPAVAPHEVPLVRQTWLARKKGRYIALRPHVDRGTLAVRWVVVESGASKLDDAKTDLGFDPAGWSSRGQTTCLVCGASVEVDYVKQQGLSGRIGVSPLTAVIIRPSARGREYVAPGAYGIPDEKECQRRLAELDVKPPGENLVHNYNQAILVPMYGLKRFQDLFTPRQLLALCTLAQGVRDLREELASAGVGADRASAVATCLAIVIDKVADYCNSLCSWHSASGGEKVNHAFARQALPMVWDFAEANPFAGASGDVRRFLDWTARTLEEMAVGKAATVIRGSATALALEDESQDAVVTDPPYYDNISYADLSDFFYVWLKQAIGPFYPDDLASELTPKRNEAVSVLHRHGGDPGAARAFYEDMMARSFGEAHRVLKPEAPLVCIYAHKTTLGWSTLVDALRMSGFTITEAWPLSTEMPQRSRGRNSAALASSIFLVARKRAADAGTGYEAQVLSELDSILRERLARLQEAKISGSDLVIALVGAGLRAFTRFEQVEQDNGEELPAERFLTLVQDRVLDTIFGSLAGADAATRFYVAGQFSYSYAWVPFDEAKNLAYVSGVELDGPHALTSGSNPIVDKERSKVRLRDFDDRGSDPELGIPKSEEAMHLIDVAHGVLWRAEYRPSELKDYLTQARPDAHALRQVVQALAGKALRSGNGESKPEEAQAAERLLAAWRTLIDENLFSGS